MTDQQSGWLDEDSMYDSLLNQVDKMPEGWRPEPGSTLVGRVNDISEGSSEYGDYPLITVEMHNGSMVAVHCFHAALKNEIERKITQGRLNIGDDIAFKYFGEGEAKGGNNAPNLYRVAVRPAKQ